MVVTSTTRSSRRNSRGQEAPLSPTTERWMKQNEEALRNTIKVRAVEELMKNRESTCGIAVKGDIQRIIMKYKENGFNFITKGVMDYMIAKYKKQYTNSCPVPVVVPTEIITNIDGSFHSDLTPGTFEEGVNVTDIIVTNQGGRPKGAEAAEKERLSRVMKEALTKAATLCYEQKVKAVLADTAIMPGTYKEIISLVEQEEKLPSGSISMGTIRSRVLRKNLSGHKPQSPLAALNHSLSSIV